LLTDARIGKVAPVTEELLLNFLATQVLGLPRSF
jgi:acyl-CoA dehydrogenase